MDNQTDKIFKITRKVSCKLKLYLNVIEGKIKENSFYL